jgi:hypothetical protein
MLPSPSLRDLRASQHSCSGTQSTVTQRTVESSAFKALAALTLAVARSQIHPAAQFPTSSHVMSGGALRRS